MSAVASTKYSKLNQQVSHEAALLDYAVRLARHRQGRRAAHVHLSRLAPANRREHHIRIAMSTLEPLLRKFGGSMFRLSSDDLIVALKDASAANIGDYLGKLEFLFFEDPLFDAQTGAGFEFCTLYDMMADYASFLRLSRDLEARASHQRKLATESQNAKAPKAQSAGESGGQEMTPGQLERFEAALLNADLAPLIQRQMICTMPADGKPQPVMCEFFVSIPALQKKFLPGVNCAGDRWLFQHLSQFLDYRMLVALPGLIKDMRVPVTINININTLLSAEFLKFDALMSQNKQLTMLFEVQSMDIFGDMRAYLFARNFLRERSYGVALDGLTYLTFPLIDCKKLKLDFQKIIWQPGMAAEIRADLINSIKQSGASRVILCRCDNQDAINFGIEAGIALFQGRHLDSMLAAG